MTPLQVYLGSDGDETKALYARLETFGPIGQVAVNLFRASKCSARAKVYRGGGYKGAAYDRKQWSVDNLCKILNEHGATLGIRFGWKQDPEQEYHDWVLYVDLPQGQVSFHAASRGAGPDYPSDWDGRHESATRIIQFCDSILETVWRLTDGEP